VRQGSRIHTLRLGLCLAVGLLGLATACVDSSANMSARNSSYDAWGCIKPPAHADESPASWTPEDRSLAASCLYNKRIYIMGNSVARHWAFTLMGLLKGDTVAPTKMHNLARGEQKEYCGASGNRASSRFDGGKPLPWHHPTRADDCYGTCKCVLNMSQPGLEILGPRAEIVFGYHLPFTSASLEPMLMNGFERGRTAPPDILVFNAGVPIEAAPFLAQHDRSGLNEVKEGAPALAKLVGRVLANTSLRFYWRTTTPRCDLKAIRGMQGVSRNGYDFGSSNNVNTRIINDHVSAYLCKVPGVVRLDAYQWASDRCDAYDDEVHHSALGFSHVLAFLRAECPALHQRMASRSPTRAPSSSSTIEAAARSAPAAVAAVAAVLEEAVRAATAEVASAPATAVTKVSYTQLSARGDCCSRNTSRQIDGHAWLQTVASSPQDCEPRCSAFPKCTSFSHSTKSRDCFLCNECQLDETRSSRYYTSWLRST